MDGIKYITEKQLNALIRIVGETASLDNEKRKD